jgi:hypothetical protein
MMSRANTDIGSLETARQQLVDFRESTELFWRGANCAFDSLEQDVARCRRELEQAIEDACVQRGSTAASGGSSELSRMLYEDAARDNRGIAELEERLERLHVLECSYFDQRDSFIMALRGLLQDDAGSGQVEQGLSNLIRMLEEYLGR